ncbi:MAG: PQQ-binding-like beta-propeller repeat protein [Porticoccaceae bacterium]|nr:PQQ-binding-like beta-propeller repeat protein [Porticoccaceae bacterium]
MRFVFAAFWLACSLITEANTFYRYPLTHTGHYPEEVVSSTPSLYYKKGLLNVGIHTAAKSSPVIDQGVLYVGVDTGHIYAIDANSGTTLWSFAVRPQAAFGIHGTAAVDGRFVYIGAYDGWLYQLDKLTGELAEQYKLGDFIGASPVIWNKKVYVGVETSAPNGYVACVQPGETKWDCMPRYFLGGHTHATPTINTESGRIFLGANSDRFVALDGVTGELIWRFDSQGDIKSTAALFEKNVYFTSWDHHVYALDQGSGKLCWRFNTGAMTMSSPSIDEKLGLLFVGSHNGSFFGLDARTGMEIWRFNTGGKILSSGTIASLATGESVVIVGSADGRIYWLRAQDGVELFSYQTQAKVTSVPLIHEGRVYVSGDDGFLYVFQ